MSKNVQKHESYKFAFDRIKIALDENNSFPFEAIVLEESIITDRLLAFLEVQGVKLKPNVGLGKCVNSVKKIIGAQDSFYVTLNQIDKWRNDRNSCVHGAVKSEADRNIPEFGSKVILNEAYQIAQDGRELAKKVRTWSEKMKRQALKQSRQNL